MQSSKMNEIIYKRLDDKIFNHLVVYFRIDFYLVSVPPAKPINQP